MTHTGWYDKYAGKVIQPWVMNERQTYSEEKKYEYLQALLEIFAHSFVSFLLCWVIYKLCHH